MPKRVTIQPHLQLEELETRYRQASELSFLEPEVWLLASLQVERSRYHIIWLKASGGCSGERSPYIYIDDTPGHDITPLEGLMMGTRSGSVDSGILLH